MKMTKNFPTSRTETEFVEIPFYGMRLNRVHTFTDGKYKGKQVKKELVFTYEEIEELQNFLEETFSV